MNMTIKQVLDEGLINPIERRYLEISEQDILIDLRCYQLDSVQNTPQATPRNKKAGFRGLDRGDLW